jgi:glycosyltransferase involved in cell wall biosynthesis
MLKDIDVAVSGNQLYPVNLLHINADIFPTSLIVLGAEFFLNRINIGFWMWETADIPEDRAAYSVFLNEIWTPSTFCRDVIAKKVATPVRVMPLNVRPEIQSRLGRKEFRLPADAFIFLWVGDFLSVVERKNPLGVLEAFAKARAELRNAYLVLKISNATYRPEVIDMMRKYKDKIPSLIIMNSDLPKSQFNSLVNCCDCLVSLHRSEGFGLVLAEAMYMGKPVIATGWSGNMDFMTRENSILIGYELVQLENDYPPYGKGSFWADPHVDEAVEAMVKIATDQHYAWSLGKKAREDIQAGFSPESTGIVLRNHLENILQQL